MSEHRWPVLAVIPAEFGDALEVAHDPVTREVRIGIVHRGEEEACAWISPKSRDAFRELLDRAAMPGQVSDGE